jgi:hypothetical protein
MTEGKRFLSPKEGRSKTKQSNEHGEDMIGVQETEAVERKKRNDLLEKEKKERANNRGLDDVGFLFFFNALPQRRIIRRENLSAPSPFANRPSPVAIAEKKGRKEKKGNLQY